MKKEGKENTKFKKTEIEKSEAKNKKAKTNKTPSDQKPKVAKKTKMPKQDKNSTAKSNKSHKKLCVIIASIVGGLAALGLLVWGIISMVTANQPLEQDWAQTYYVYLEENPLDPQLKTADDEVIANADQYEVEFYDLENLDDPLMAVNYVTDDKNYVTYYWMEEDEVKRAVVNDPSEIVLLYDIKEKKSDYYIHYEKNDINYYKSLDKELSTITVADDSKHVKENAEYKFSEDDVDSVKDKDGNEHTLTKFEQTFVEIEDESVPITLPVNYDNNELKNTIRDEAYEYKVLEEVAKEHAEMVRKVIEDIEKRQEEIKNIEKENAEIEAKKKAEEEAKRAAEEAKKGIKLEGYTISYGTYLLDEAYVGPTNGEYTLVLKPNGICTYGGKSCTWKLGKRDYAQSEESRGKAIHQSIIVDTTGGGYGISLFAYGNNELGDGDIEHYVYSRR
ncbi:hypothetical protein IKF28_01530 [Candidatus Saccharibacteria bacterium]|nr:hypothetical protein [Candidatus Saccharibacteria bacterium]